VKRLYRFVVVSFLGPFILTFFITLFILLMQFLWKYIDDLAGKGLSIGVLGELLFFVAASLLPMALPLAVLLASLMTMGNLGENYELTAMKSSGISLPRILSPLIVLAVVISFLALLAGNYLTPYANLKFKSLLFDITQQKPELQIREGIFTKIGDYSVRVAKKDYKTSLLHDIMIYDHTVRNDGNTQVSVADSGKIETTANKKYLLVTLYNGQNYTDYKRPPGRETQARYNTYPFRRDKFRQQEILISLTGYGLNHTDENLFKNNYQMLSMRQLKKKTDSIVDIKERRAYQLKRLIYDSHLFRAKQLSMADSVRKKISKDRVCMDSAFDKLSVTEKISMNGSALYYARESNVSISTTSQVVEDIENNVRKYKIEWWRKITYSAACLIFFFIGAPLGAIIRKGGLGMPVVISVLFFVLYYIVSLSGEKFAKEGVISPIMGMWISSLILLPLGVFLTYKATRDSALMSMDMYTNFFKKLGKFLYRHKQDRLAKKS
jgi:lipopolysaccharide export system permease protein